VLDNLSPHLSAQDRRVGDWAAGNDVELAYVPFYASSLNRIEPQFTALRYFAPDGTDHPTHRAQASMIRRYIAWRTVTSRTSGSATPSSGRRLPDSARVPPMESRGTRSTPHGRSRRLPLPPRASR
jgi:hypothetical protein